MFRGKIIKNTFATISASATFCAASIGSAARIARLRSGVLGAVVGDPEQPGAERRGLLQLVQGNEGPGEGVLLHILALDHRAHQARAVAVRGLCSTRLSLEDRNPRIALQAEGEARGILRIVEHRD